MAYKLFCSPRANHPTFEKEKKKIEIKEYLPASYTLRDFKALLFISRQEQSLGNSESEVYASTASAPESELVPRG